MRNKLAVALILLTAAHAQTPPASLEGTVTHATTGEPLPRVHVTLNANNNGTQHSYGAMTGPDGHFSVTGIVPGNYTIVGERVGFVMPPGPSGTSVLTSASPKADEKKTDFQLKMLPTGAITGRVTDSEGEPIQGAAVDAESDSSITDEKGQFRIGGLAPGRYRVRASTPFSFLRGGPEIRADGTVDIRHATTWYPGVVALKQAAFVEVRPAGDTSGIDIQLVRVPWVKVSGKVTGGADRASVNARREGDKTGRSSPVVQAKPDGSFELWGVDPGRYTIFAVSSGRQSSRTVPVEIEVASSNIENLTLRFLPPADIAGRLEFETEGAKQLPKTTRTITLREVGTSYFQTAAAQVQDDDTFLFSKIAAGYYRVSLSWNTAYVKSTREAGTVKDGALIDLTIGATANDVSLMLAAADASITGTVQNEQNNPTGTRVVLVENNSDPGAIPLYAIAKADGTYTFSNLPPGSYLIAAVQQDETFGEMQPIELHPGDKVTKDLKRRAP